MTPQKIAVLVKRVISRRTGAKVGAIRYSDNLADKYGFDDMAKQHLAPSLNADFAASGEPIIAQLQPWETQACSTVGDLGRLIRGRFGI